MKILENENLSRYTSIGIGGNAIKMYVPESIEEMIEISRNIDCSRILGGVLTF